MEATESETEAAPEDSPQKGEIPAKDPGEPATEGNEPPWDYMIAAIGSGLMAAYSTKSPENRKSPPIRKAQTVDKVPVYAGTLSTV